MWKRRARSDTPYLNKLVHGFKAAYYVRGFIPPSWMLALKGVSVTAALALKTLKMKG